MNRYKAFLLFEVLVTILIASTVIVVLLQGLGNVLSSSNSAENYFKASLLAEAQLVFLEKEVSVKPDVESGRFSDEEDPERAFSWETKITPIRISSLIGAQDLPICETYVTVSCKQNAGQKHFTLVTYLTKYEESAPER